MVGVRAPNGVTAIQYTSFSTAMQAIFGRVILVSECAYGCFRFIILGVRVRVILMVLFWFGD